MGGAEETPAADPNKTAGSELVKMERMVFVRRHFILPTVAAEPPIPDSHPSTVLFVNVVWKSAPDVPAMKTTYPPALAVSNTLFLSSTPPISMEFGPKPFTAYA